MKLSYPVCIYPNNSEPGYTAIVPDLPGCVTCGDNMQDVFEMAVDAASGWVLTELEDGKLPPKSSNIQSIHADEYPNGFTSMLFLNMDSYIEKYGEKSVRKNCTIPSWLNAKAEEAGINFSAVLREALENRLNIN